MSEREVGSPVQPCRRVTVVIREKPRVRVSVAPRGAAQQPETLNAVGLPRGGSYIWQIADRNTARIIGSGATASVLGLSRGTTRVTVTYTFQGQTAADTTEVEALDRVDPLISPNTETVIVKKSYTTPARKTVTLRTSAAFTGSGTFTRSAGAIHFFTAASGGTEITFNGTDNVFPGAQLTSGVQLFAEGASASAVVNDVRLRLTLTGGSAPVGPPATATMTSVDVKLDICRSRTTAGTDPDPIPAVDKMATGRFVHVQDTGNHHGRAMLIVHQARPTAFTGELELTPINGRVQLFAAETGGAAMATPHRIPNAGIPATGTKLWAQGATVSGGLRDTGFRLGVRNVEPDGDRVAMTVIRFRRLEARIHVTRPNQVRHGNWPAAVRRHFLRRGTTANPDPTNYDEDYATNPPLVLLEDSVLAARPIELSVRVEPAGVPVSWTVPRDTRAAPNGDHADIVALRPGEPTLTTPVGGDRLRATLLADRVGSFHICPYVDCNGNNQFDFNDAAGARIDREPYIFMNLVLVRATLHRDQCMTHAPLVGAAAGGGIGVTSGAFNIATPNNAAIHLNAQVDLVGGGGDGRRGLNRVFGGWINNESANEDIAGTFRDTTVAPAVEHRSFSVFASNWAAATGGVFLPTDPVPVLVAPPLLDSGRGGAGTGGNTATLTTSRIRPPRTNRPTGQRLVVEAVDSPGDGDDPSHPGFPAARLVRFRFRLFFRAYLSVWTNVSGNSGATVHAANRLYSTLLVINWRMQGEWNVNPGTGAVANVGAPRVRITGRTPRSPSVATATTGAEVRAPTGLRLLARNARA